MRAIDTNIVVRLLARDNDDQLETAENLIGSPFLVLPTVILEAVWVLQTTYRLPRGELVLKLNDLLGNKNAILVSADALKQAVNSYGAGGDFGDMLHLALAAEANAESFATFDQKLVKAGADFQIPIETVT
jgi:predicted nucleic-acid-binding protein